MSSWHLEHVTALYDLVLTALIDAPQRGWSATTASFPQLIHPNLVVNWISVSITEELDWPQEALWKVSEFILYKKIKVVNSIHDYWLIFLFIQSFQRRPPSRSPILPTVCPSFHASLYHAYLMFNDADSRFWLTPVAMKQIQLSAAQFNCKYLAYELGLG